LKSRYTIFTGVVYFVKRNKLTVRTWCNVKKKENVLKKLKQVAKRERMEKNQVKVLNSK